MTRNEAIRKLNIIYSDDTYRVEHFADALEALGLIKFDEEKVPEPASIISLEINDITITPHSRADRIIDSLSKYGYIIARKGS